MFLLCLRRVAFSKFWPVVEGTITASGLDARTRLSGGAHFNKVKVFSPKTSFKYQVNGVEYISKKLGFCNYKALIKSSLKWMWSDFQRVRTLRFTIQTQPQRRSTVAWFVGGFVFLRAFLSFRFGYYELIRRCKKAIYFNGAIDAD